MEKIYGVAILYYPNQEVIANIASYIPYLHKLYLFDNSEPSTNMDFSNQNAKIQFFADGINKGISERLNAAAKLAIAEGATWLLTMDQDSSFDSGELEKYISCFTNFGDKERVAMFGINHEDKFSNNTCSYLETDNIITSGSLVNLDVFQKIGGFDENLFIDDVDSEYCYKANTNGFSSIKFQNILLKHSLGEVSIHRSLKNRKKTFRTLHSPLRIYYMVRNFLYVRNKYQKQLPHSFPYRKTVIINRIKNNFLYGKEKTKLLKYVWLAYRHYKSGKMGRFSNF